MDLDPHIQDWADSGPPGHWGHRGYTEVTLSFFCSKPLIFECGWAVNLLLKTIEIGENPGIQSDFCWISLDLQRQWKIFRGIEYSGKCLEIVCLWTKARLYVFSFSLSVALQIQLKHFYSLVEPLEQLSSSLYCTLMNLFLLNWICCLSR